MINEFTADDNEMNICLGWQIKGVTTLENHEDEEVLLGRETPNGSPKKGHWYTGGKEQQ
jgi:hypothetical protein